jgi:ATP adenylyltransferase
MDYIWAPWRMAYVNKAIAKEDEGCIFCQKPKEDTDEANLIVYRGKLNFIIMNSFPYNPGHLMVVPYRHLGHVEGMTPEEAADHFTMVQKAVKLLKGVLQPAGFNVGMNLGRIAGAGIADHIHTHIVPRWQGDTNFMPVVADIKVIPEAVIATYHKVKAGLKDFE